jgi:hypothetical protein
LGNKKSIKTVKYLRLEVMMTLQQWFDKVGGKYIDFDGIYGAQCVDLVKSYFVDVIGIPAIRNNAIDYWTNYPTAQFTRITNTPSFVPIKGDIMIWGKGVGTYGHIAIIVDANVNTFRSLDQNWPYSNGTTPSKVITHNYSSVLGVLRPKKDVNFDQANAAAQAEADRIAREKAAIEKAEQARIAAEQAKLEADRLAKLKAEEEAERIANEIAEKVRAEEIAAENKWYSFFTNLIKFIKEKLWK